MNPSMDYPENPDSSNETQIEDNRMKTYPFARRRSWLLSMSFPEFAMDDTKELVFGEKDYNQAHRAFRGVAMAARDISTAVKTVLEAERLHMGEATQIVGHKDLDEMSIEDLMAEIAEADDSIADAKRRGLVAIDGGKVSS